MRAYGAAMLFALGAWAQSGSVPHATADEYPVHGDFDGFRLGAEYWVHGFRGHDQMFITNSHLVVEVAIYPEKKKPVMVNAGHFSLRLNGKTVLMPQSAAMVAASLRYPDWDSPRQVEGHGSVGNAGVIIGQVPSSRFPGDNRAPQQPYPRVPKAPGPELGGAQRSEPVRAEDVVVETALPEGSTAGPVSGFLYFRWKGKAEKIRSLELVHQGSGDPVAMRLK